MNCMFENRIIELVKLNPGQCSVNEYRLLTNAIISKAPCNLLIFGLGNDSQLWLDANDGGKTIFLENCNKWIETIKSRIGDHLDVRKVTYTTDIQEWESILDDASKLKIDLNDDIIKVEWDIIFIDSPMGCGTEGAPGRMQSIYTASLLCCEDYYLHDIDRPIERIYGDRYLGKIKTHIDRMNHYGN